MSGNEVGVLVAASCLLLVGVVTATGREPGRTRDRQGQRLWGAVLGVFAVLLAMSALSVRSPVLTVAQGVLVVLVCGLCLRQVLRRRNG